MARTGSLHRRLDYVLGVPLVWLLSHRRRKRTLPLAPGRIGLICPSAIGDVILNTGLLAHLRATYPEAEIHIFHAATNGAAVALLPVPVIAHECDFTNIPKTLRTIRRAGLDVMIDIAPWPRLTALYAALSGAISVGFDSPGQHRHFAFDIAITIRPAHHMTENIRAVAEVFAPCPKYELQLKHDLPQPPALPYEQLVVCHVSPGGARAVEKSWPSAYWAELTRRLVAEGYVVGFTGVAADAPAVDLVLSETGASAESAFSLCGQLSLPEVAAVLQRARLLITVDTGILHLGSALGIPMLGLHGPTSSHLWGGRGTASMSLDAPHSAAGFVKFGFERHPDGRQIMASLDIDVVHAAAGRALALVGEAPVSGESVGPVREETA